MPLWTMLIDSDHDWEVEARRLPLGSSTPHSNLTIGQLLTTDQSLTRHCDHCRVIARGIEDSSNNARRAEAASVQKDVEW